MNICVTFFVKKGNQRNFIMEFVGFFLLKSNLVGPSGLEPPTSCLSGTRSNLLSYEPMWLVWIFIHTWTSISHLAFRTCALGGDDGIRLSRELRAQSFAGKTRPPEEFFTRLLLRTPLFTRRTQSSYSSLVEMMGFEPMTPCLQGRCSPSWATPPY